MLYDTKYCWRHITKPIPSIVGAILQRRYQVLLAAQGSAVSAVVFKMKYINK
jgi:hypothetical protein